ncbi:GNAT family N-acetyltransferase [Pseudomonas yamanorum]|jgi:GNAT superfamily N-acetyltransferase|uniref:GNAT family N-acetyltransferase n=1 Tax=Pseudomonas yamanorum TaxID=515393 RepID=UPI003F751F6D
MHSTATCDLAALYHHTEEHFLTALCPLIHRYSACVNAYFADEHPVPWNLLIVLVGSSALDHSMDAPLELIRRTPLPTRVLIHQDTVEGLGEVLIGMGFVAVERTTAMVLELSTFTPVSRDSDLNIHLTRHLSEWAGPIGSAYALQQGSIAHYQARHQRALDSDQGLYHFTLSVSVGVVCALTLSMCDGVARLNDIATEIAWRGKGYATQLIHAALAHAQALGARRCFLEATPQGLSLYRKQGFNPLFEYQAFIRGAVVQAEPDGVCA